MRCLLRRVDALGEHIDRVVKGAHERHVGLKRRVGAAHSDLAGRVIDSGSAERSATKVKAASKRK